MCLQIHKKTLLNFEVKPPQSGPNSVFLWGAFCNAPGHTSSCFLIVAIITMCSACAPHLPLRHESGLHLPAFHRHIRGPCACPPRYTPYEATRAIEGQRTVSWCLDCRRAEDAEGKSPEEPRSGRERGRLKAFWGVVTVPFRRWCRKKLSQILDNYGTYYLI